MTGCGYGSEQLSGSYPFLPTVEYMRFQNAQIPWHAIHWVVETPYMVMVSNFNVGGRYRLSTHLTTTLIYCNLFPIERFQQQMYANYIVSYIESKCNL